MVNTRRQFLQRIAVAAPSLHAAFAHWRALAAAEATTPAAAQAPPWLAELSKTKEWQRLDAAWDEMGRHGGPNMRWPGNAAERMLWRIKSKQFDALKQRLADALDAVEKQMSRLGADQGGAEALRVLCMQRHYHIWRSRYVMATCYEPSYLGTIVAGSCAALERQLASLQQLKSQGKLTPEAAAKAERLIAERAEVLAQASAMGERYDRKDVEALMAKIDHQTGGLKPGAAVSQPAADCARMVVELARE